MKEGDYAWGAWLAFLRPHKDLVPALLAALKDRPNDLPETSLALGNSGDPRALEPLLALVKAKDYRASGDAAFAIGYLGDPKAEPVLIQALTESGWPQLQASRALAVLGSSKALPALEKLADEGSRGALNITGMARDAIVRIERRHSIRDPARWPNAPGPEPRVTLRGHGAPVWALAFSPDGKTLASVGDDQAVRLWDPSTGKATAAFAGPGRQTTEVAFAGTGKIAVAGWTEDGSIHLLDARSGRETGTIPVNKGGVGSLVASADCKLLAASGSGGNEEETVRVFDSVTGKVVATLPKAARALVFSPDGKTLATAGGTGATDVQLWDLGTGKVVNTLHSHTEAVVSASFSPDGRVLASGGDWTVRVWNLRTGKETAKFRGDSEVFGVPFDRDGRRVAAAEAGGMVRLWDVSAGRAVATLAARGPVAYSPDGTTLATAAPDSRALLLWSVDK
jgi:WD40 repeat protein